MRRLPALFLTLTLIGCESSTAPEDNMTMAEALDALSVIQAIAATWNQTPNLRQLSATALLRAPSTTQPMPAVEVDSSSSNETRNCPVRGSSTARYGQKTSYWQGATVDSTRAEAYLDVGFNKCQVVSGETDVEWTFDGANAMKFRANSRMVQNPVGNSTGSLTGSVTGLFTYSANGKSGRCTIDIDIAVVGEGEQVTTTGTFCGQSVTQMGQGQ